jgi:hypothetical protein
MARYKHIDTSPRFIAVDLPCGSTDMDSSLANDNH